MKTIQLKEGPMIGEQVLSTKYLIKLCLDSPPDGGFKYKDFKERARVENAMDDVKHSGAVGTDFFELEDNDYANLCKWVRAMTWLTRSQFVIDFCEQFLN